ncbi:hypothetical protein BS17DRAFT_692483 [Gyrodon lividus]|nr:hypothetical protein BS17DRAFT_692483 [Gyrodon lividus]
MSLSLKAELETWAAALKSYDEQDFDNALALFSQIADSSKILTNMGLIYATIGEHEAAVEHFTAATNLDAYLAIAHFQCGVSNFLLGRYDLAFANFGDAHLYLRGNQAINYEQIGLKFKLFSAEVLFNKGLSQIYFGYPQEGMYDLDEARKEKVTEEHDVINDAIRDRGEGYTVFSIPVGVLYRPSENKLKNSKTKDYLGKAKLVAASDSNDAFTEFTGVKKLQQASAENDTKTDADAETTQNLSRSATAPAPRPDPANALPRPFGLERSKTTIQVPTDSRERIAGMRSPSSRPTTPTSRRSQSVSNPSIPPLPVTHKRSNTALSRGNTTIGPLRPKTPQSVDEGKVGDGSAVSRGMSMRRPQLPPPALQLQPPLPAQALPQIQVQAPPTARQTLQKLSPFFYDDYVGAYTDDAPRPLPQQPPSAGERSLAWTQYSAASSLNTRSGNYSVPGPSPGVNRAPSRSAASHMNLGGIGGLSGLNNGGGGTLRRKLSRRPTVRKKAMYEEDDDGFVTGEYDEGPLELGNIRIKLHYQDDVRGMTLPPDTPFADFVERVTSKFGTPLDGLGLKFKDEDGTKITLRDESDYELALETARDSVGRGEGKLEVWCMDV